ncbi:MAG: 4-hydroxythreonine-4-phosphate dehydrogenase PdxA [Alphaproteobacteria bacterium]|nr:4-hydroxythreonine-4-phosphate dehydrogenase PdxA [Alphaproteobacteria bacterium]
MKRPLAVTMGEPAGVGGEVMLAAFAARAQHKLPPFVAFDDPERLRTLAGQLGIEAEIAEIRAPGEAAALPRGPLPVVPVKLATRCQPGKLDAANAPAVIESIKRAVEAVQRGDCAGVVTAPIQKSTLQQAGFKHPGHTEFLAELAGIKTPPVMLLAAQGLRVVPVTVHVPLRTVAEALTTEKIVAIAAITAEDLHRKLGIASPRLAVAGLNPHAGEDGKIGDEEQKIIAPAIAALRARGIAASGPHPPDTMFHAEARKDYDCAICMYHDQALIPLKTLDFWGGVNVTLGLPFIRTSPDHGTALGIAGRGTANAESFINALLMARDMASRIAP